MVEPLFEGNLTYNRLTRLPPTRGPRVIRHIPGACEILYWEGGSTVRPFDLFYFQIWVALDLPNWRLRKGSVAGLGGTTHGWGSHANTKNATVLASRRVLK